jgi:hypothetical protein
MFMILSALQNMAENVTSKFCTVTGNNAQYAEENAPMQGAM